MEKIPLTVRQYQQLADVELLITTLLTEDNKDNDALESLYRKLAKEHLKIKSFFTNIVAPNLLEKDYIRLKEIDVKCKRLLHPIYEELTKRAVETCIEFYYRIEKMNMVEEPIIYDFQKKLMKFFFGAIIFKRRIESIQTLLLSRGGSKTYILSICTFFLSLYWKDYVYHSARSDFLMLIIAPSEKQLASFKQYINNMLSICITGNLIAEKPSDIGSSEMKMVTYKNNQTEYVLRNIQGADFSSVYYRLASESLEGIHADIIISDEAKFLDRKTFNTSVLPCAGGRLGNVVAISSASQEYCYFQDLVENNIKIDLEEFDEGEQNVEQKGTFGDKGFEFVGDRTFIQHYTSMIKERPDYASTVQRALNECSGNEEDPSFLTQYHNVFLSNKKSTFFNISELRSIGSIPIINSNINNFLRKDGWILVAGWDVAVGGEDASTFTIKAIPNDRIGIDRFAQLLSIDCLNTARSTITETVYNQAEKVAKFIVAYDIKILAIDITGGGQTADQYVLQHLKNINVSKSVELKIVPFSIQKHSRFSLLENYYKRLQNGQEKLQPIEKDWENEDYLRKEYGTCWRLYSEKDMYAKFIFEHQKFTRRVIDDKEAGKSEIKYYQDAQSFIHDDTVFSSALASWCLHEYPTIRKYSKTGVQYRENRQSGFASGIFNNGKIRRF